ncbi:MAG: hypothetical protein U9R07_05390 [Pseudomonadota bacterium]|nr:hypothetical protein [Pseudomonadota bacterium]
MWIVVPLTIIWLIASLVLASFGKWAIWRSFIGFLFVACLAGFALGNQIELLEVIVGMSIYLGPLALALGATIWFARRLELALVRKKES